MDNGGINRIDRWGQRDAKSPLRRPPARRRSGQVPGVRRVDE